MPVARGNTGDEPDIAGLRDDQRILDTRAVARGACDRADIPGRDLEEAILDGGIIARLCEDGSDVSSPGHVEGRIVDGFVAGRGKLQGSDRSDACERNKGAAFDRGAVASSGIIQRLREDVSDGPLRRAERAEADRDPIVCVRVRSNRSDIAGRRMEDRIAQAVSGCDVPDAGAGDDAHVVDRAP